MSPAPAGPPWPPACSSTSRSRSRRHQLMNLRTIPGLHAEPRGLRSGLAAMDGSRPDGFALTASRPRTTSTCSSLSSVAWSTPSTPTTWAATVGPVSSTARSTCSSTTSASKRTRPPNRNKKRSCHPPPRRTRQEAPRERGSTTRCAWRSPRRVREVADLLDGLAPEQWAAADCPGWNVRAIAGHMLGMMQMAASFPELIRQQAASVRRARRRGGLLIDALTALQVEKNAALAPVDIAPEVRRLAPRAVMGRRRPPALVRDRARPWRRRTAGRRRRLRP